MKDELAINVVRTNGADHVAQGSNIANAAAHIVRGRTKILNSKSDANLIASDSNDSAYGPNNNYEDVYDGGGTKSKWKSSRDLTTYDKTKQKKEKKRKKPKGKLPKISQGLLDILNLNGDRVNNNSNHVSDSCIDTNPTTISIPVPIGIPKSSFSNKNIKNLVVQTNMSPALTNNDLIVPNLPTNGKKND